MQSNSQIGKQILIPTEQTGKYQLNVETLLSIDIEGGDIVKILSMDLGIEEEHIQSVLFSLSNEISNCYVSSCNNRIPELVELLEAFQELSGKSIENESGQVFTMPYFNFEIPQIIFEKAEKEQADRKVILSEILSSVLPSYLEKEQAGRTVILPEILSSVSPSYLEKEQADRKVILSEILSSVLPSYLNQLNTSTKPFIDNLDDLFGFFNENSGAFQEAVLEQMGATNLTEEQMEAVDNLHRVLEHFANKNEGRQLSTQQMEMLKNNSVFVDFIGVISEALPMFLEVNISDHLYKQTISAAEGCSRS